MLTLSSIFSHSRVPHTFPTRRSSDVQINANSQSYQAGDGTGTAVVDLTDNAPTFRNNAGTATPGAFTYEQAADIADVNIPAASQFGGIPPTTYTIQSDNGAVTLVTG